MIRILEPARIFCALAILALLALGANWTHSGEFTNQDHHKLAENRLSVVSGHDHFDDSIQIDASTEVVHCGSDNILVRASSAATGLPRNGDDDSIKDIFVAVNYAVIDPPPPKKFPV